MKTVFVSIPVQGAELAGDLIFPEKSSGIILFSHGSGSSRNSPRNKAVAEFLNKNGFATLLFDLLTPDEDEVYENRFNIDLLSERLMEVIKWVRNDALFKSSSLGLFGASTGAASALFAAACLKDDVLAVVSRGGRPDLALKVLEDVEAATLLIVGELDEEVLRLNEKAYGRLNCKKNLEVVKGATHLFEEPGKLKIVASLAADWYKLYLK